MITQEDIDRFSEFDTDISREAIEKQIRLLDRAGHSPRLGTIPMMERMADSLDVLEAKLALAERNLHKIWWALDVDSGDMEARAAHMAQQTIKKIQPISRSQE